MSTNDPDRPVVQCQHCGELEADVKYLLSFAPKGEVPAGLSATFYHTLTYSGDVEIQKRIDKIAAKLEGGEDE